VWLAGAPAADAEALRSACRDARRSFHHPESSMRSTRREFLETTVGAMAATGLSRLAPRRPREVIEPSSGPLRILILGGTSFLGPHLVHVMLGRGHRVSIFTRGRTQPPIYAELFDQVEHLTGDRAGDLAALAAGRWDAVIDNSGQRVEWARDSARLLKDRARYYLYVSSTGVYYPYRTADIPEDGPVLLADDPPRDPPSYGVMKALSERAVRAEFGDRAIVVRPQYIVGPADASDRFTYWPVRVDRGGTVLVPGKHDDPIEYIDVRDLTEWMVRLVEAGTTGVFNAVGPEAPLTMAEFVYGLRAVTAKPVHWVWADDYDFLRAQRLLYAIPWLLPEGDTLGAARIANQQALAAGITFRPLAVTVRDTLDWWYSPLVSDDRRQHARFVLTPEREVEILAAWAGRD
jgi:2'-hydroxyisoflavone reductase